MKILFAFLLLVNGICYSQVLSVAQINPLLKINAHAIIQKNHIKVEFNRKNNLKTTEDIVITILDKSADDLAYNFVNYNPYIKVLKYNASLFDANGNEIKKFKDKEIIDVSTVPNGTLYTEEKVKFVRPLAVNYPYTMVYHTEVESNTTAFIHSVLPIYSYHASVIDYQYTFVNNSGIIIRKSEKNLNQYALKISETGNTTVYTLKDQVALEPEFLSPRLNDVTPSVEFVASIFMLNGVEGNFSDWKEFGNFFNDKLLPGLQDLSESDKQQAKKLVAGITDKNEIVNILYNFMQNKVRYINVNIGVGGWKPYPASYVSSKSYGDCKALSNYMKALLDAVGIESYLCVIYGGKLQRLDENFASIRGNHMVLAIPEGDDYIWLECTSQTNPSDFNGSFTGNRNALAITPEGGKIIKTHYYSPDDNLVDVKAVWQIDRTGQSFIKYKQLNSGVRYDEIDYYDLLNQNLLQNYVKDKFSKIPDLKFSNNVLKPNKSERSIAFELDLTSELLIKKQGQNFILSLVPFSEYSENYKKDNSRKYPMKIDFGESNSLTLDIILPFDYKMSGDFKPINFESEFGSYELTLLKSEDNKIIVNRKLLIKDGTYPKEKYNDFIAFTQQIKVADNSKILIEKNN